MTPVNDPASAPPVVTGKTELSKVLSVDTSAITDPDSGVANISSIQWIAIKPDGTEVILSGQTGTTFAPTTNEIGFTIVSEINYTDNDGFINVVRSPAVGPITVLPPVIEPVVQPKAPTLSSSTSPREVVTNIDASLSSNAQVFTTLDTSGEMFSEQIPKEMVVPKSISDKESYIKGQEVYKQALKDYDPAKDVGDIVQEIMIGTVQKVANGDELFDVSQDIYDRAVSSKQPNSTIAEVVFYISQSLDSRIKVQDEFLRMVAFDDRLKIQQIEAILEKINNEGKDSEMAEKIVNAISEHRPKIAEQLSQFLKELKNNSNDFISILRGLKTKILYTQGDDLEQSAEYNELEQRYRIEKAKKNILKYFS